MDREDSEKSDDEHQSRSQFPLSDRDSPQPGPSRRLPLEDLHPGFPTQEEWASWSSEERLGHTLNVSRWETRQCQQQLQSMRDERDY